MNRPHAIAALIAALLALSAGTASAAQLYKWVDERGVVNYSNQLPVDPKSAKNVKEVEDRVSVYTPDPALVREIAAFRQRINQAAYDIPEPRQPAVAMLGTPSPSPTMVYGAYTDDYPYWNGGGWGGGGFRPYRPHPSHPISQVRLPPGAIAGNTVGLYSIMPGNSYPVPSSWSPVAPQLAPNHTHRQIHTQRDYRNR